MVKALKSHIQIPVLYEKLKPRARIRAKQLGSKVGNMLELRCLLWLPGRGSGLSSQQQHIHQDVPHAWMDGMWASFESHRASHSACFLLIFYSFPNLLVSMIFSLNTCTGFESWGENSRDFKPKGMPSLTVCSNTEGISFFLPKDRSRKGNSKPQLRLGPVIYNTCPSVYVKGWLNLLWEGPFAWSFWFCLWWEAFLSVRS